MHKVLLSLIAALLSITTVNAANPQADGLLRQAADKLRNAKSVSATCAINSDGHSTQARIIMSGRRFRIESPGYATWFDGRTQWTYSASTGEVTVTEPTAGELAESNPLSVIEAFTSAYNSSITSAAGDKHESAPIRCRGHIGRSHTQRQNHATGQHRSDIRLGTESGRQHRGNFNRRSTPLLHFHI